jgi:hypothetical protein
VGASGGKKSWSRLLVFKRSARGAAKKKLQIKNFNKFKNLNQPGWRTPSTPQQDGSNMVGLIDLAPSVEMVSVQEKAVTVHGISAKGLAYLLGKFPDLRKLMTGQEVDAQQLMAAGGDAVAGIIAAGCGQPGDDKAEAIAGTLPIDTQADFLAAILRLTLPKGIGPFVGKLTALSGLLDVDARSDTAQGTTSPKPSTP